MNRAASLERSLAHGAANPLWQPNELDRRRIVRLLEKRARYLYVLPLVGIMDGGYRIQSPCCSRKVDPEGGVVDIARLEYSARLDAWTLYRKDHAEDRWEFHQLAQRLDVLIHHLNRDAGHVFWQ